MGKLRHRGQEGGGALPPRCLRAPRPAGPGVGEGREPRPRRHVAAGQAKGTLSPPLSNMAPCLPKKKKKNRKNPVPRHWRGKGTCKFYQFLLKNQRECFSCSQISRWGSGGHREQQFPSACQAFLPGSSGTGTRTGLLFSLPVSIVLAFGRLLVYPQGTHGGASAGWFVISGGP